MRYIRHPQTRGCTHRGWRSEIIAQFCAQSGRQRYRLRRRRWAKEKFGRANFPTAGRFLQMRAASARRVFDFELRRGKSCLSSRRSYANVDDEHVVRIHDSDVVSDTDTAPGRPATLDSIFKAGSDYTAAAGKAKYRDAPRYRGRLAKARDWEARRAARYEVVGRKYTASPKEEGLYYKQLLLTDLS